MTEISHYKARIHSVNGPDGNQTKARPSLVNNSKVWAKTADEAFQACIATLPKSYAKRKVVVSITPCETVDRGGHALEIALVARTDFVTRTP